jgi:hypothetical protein
MVDGAEVELTPEEEAEIRAEWAANAAAAAAVAYIEQRRSEYPPAADYLDAVVKGDTAQMQAYIDACRAVKLKYPKP